LKTILDSTPRRSSQAGRLPRHIALVGNPGPSRLAVTYVYPVGFSAGAGSQQLYRVLCVGNACDMKVCGAMDLTSSSPAAAHYRTFEVSIRITRFPRPTDMKERSTAHPSDVGRITKNWARTGWVRRRRRRGTEVNNDVGIYGIAPKGRQRSKHFRGGGSNNL